MTPFAAPLIVRSANRRRWGTRASLAFGVSYGAISGAVAGAAAGALVTILIPALIPEATVLGAIVGALAGLASLAGITRTPNGLLREVSDLFTSEVGAHHSPSEVTTVTPDTTLLGDSTITQVSCVSCGNERVSPEDSYCRYCGASYG